MLSHFRLVSEIINRGHSIIYSKKIFFLLLIITSYSTVSAQQFIKAHPTKQSPPVKYQPPVKQQAPVKQLPPVKQPPIKQLPPVKQSPPPVKQQQPIKEQVYKKQQPTELLNLNSNVPFDPSVRKGVLPNGMTYY